MNEIKKPETPREALELALWLAATAPSIKKMHAAHELAEGFAANLSEFEVRLAMRAVEKKLNEAWV